MEFQPNLGFQFSVAVLSRALGDRDLWQRGFHVDRASAVVLASRLPLCARLVQRIL